MTRRRAIRLAALLLLAGLPVASQVPLPPEAHPSLLFTEADVPLLQARIQRAPYDAWWATTLQRAETAPDPATEERTKARFAKAAAFAWWMTGDEAHAHTAARLLLDMKFPRDGGDLGEPHNEGEVVMQYAQAYDMLHPFLAGFPDSLASVRGLLADEADRLFDGIVVQEIDLGFLGSIKIRLHETTDPRDLSVIHLDNWHVRAYGGLGLAAFALADHPGSGGSDPQEWADWAFDLVTRSLIHVTDPVDGGYAESPFYQRYAADVYLPYFFALRSLAGIDRFADPLMDRAHDWSVSIRLPNGRRPNIDDGHLDDFYGHYLAGVDADGPVHHWDWLNNANGPYTRGFNEPDAIALYDDSLPAAPPQHGPTVFLPAAGDAVFRSDWSADATYLLLRGEHGRARAQGFGHEHADETSFLLYAHGEMLALDAGYINFTNHDKVNAGRSHNVILVDGEGPPILRIAGQAVDGGNDAFIEDTVADAAGDYAEVRARYRDVDVLRRVLFAGHEYFVIADHVAGAASHSYEWRLHGHGGGTSGGSYTRDGGLARWTRPGAELIAFLPARDGRVFAEADTVHSFDFLEEPTHTFLRVTDTGPTTQFLAFLVPRRIEAAAPALSAVTATGAQAARLQSGGGTATAWVRAAGTDAATVDGDGLGELASDAAFAWLQSADGTLTAYSLQDARWLRVDGAMRLSATDTVDVLLAVTPDSVAGHVRGAASGFDLHLGGVDSVAAASFAGQAVTASRDGDLWRLPLAGEGRLRVTTVVVALPVPGDFDGDGRVGLDDFFLFTDVFGARAPLSDTQRPFDLNGDGDVGLDDFFLFVDRFGT